MVVSIVQGVEGLEQCNKPVSPALKRQLAWLQEQVEDHLHRRCKARGKKTPHITGYIIPALDTSP
eukprot:4875248-Prorocentrum_lima.AAC.1